MDPAILIFDTAQAAAEACGDRILDILDQARQTCGTATLAVSGGSTPRLMFQSMARRPFDWSGVQVYQVDERCVPPGDEQSNFRMIRESLLLKTSINEFQFHRMQGELSPAEAARLYEDEIRRSMNLKSEELPVLDVIQRGMGRTPTLPACSPASVDHGPNRHCSSRVGGEDEAASSNTAAGRPGTGAAYRLPRDRG